MVNNLAMEFKPIESRVKLPCSSKLIHEVQQELTRKARADKDKCWGYFPAMEGRDSIDTQLPVSQAYAASIPNLVLHNKNLRFNFVRLSLVQQKGESPFHLDTDAATALTGNTATLSKRLVWRLLINLSDTHPRTLSYLNINPSKIALIDDGGYIHCDKKLVTEDVIRRIVIQPRKDSSVHGVLFCASRVLHTGQDDEYGHFVSGFGCEEADVNV